MTVPKFKKREGMNNPPPSLARGDVDRGETVFGAIFMLVIKPRTHAKNAKR